MSNFLPPVDILEDVDVQSQADSKKSDAVLLGNYCLLPFHICLFSSLKDCAV